MNQVFFKLFRSRHLWLFRWTSRHLLQQNLKNWSVCGSLYQSKHTFIATKTVLHFQHKYHFYFLSLSTLGLKFTRMTFSNNIQNIVWYLIYEKRNASLFDIHCRKASKVQLKAANSVIFIFYELLERKQMKLLKTFFSCVGMQYLRASWLHKFYTS